MPVSAETQLRFSSHEKTKPTYIVSLMGDSEQENLLMWTWVGADRLIQVHVYHQSVLQDNLWYIKYFFCTTHLYSIFCMFDFALEQKNTKSKRNSFNKSCRILLKMINSSKVNGVVCTGTGHQHLIKGLFIIEKHWKIVTQVLTLPLYKRLYCKKDNPTQ